MPEQTLAKIKEIEDQAQELVKVAQQKAALALIKTQEKQAEEIKTLEQTLEKETELLMETEKLKAEQEAKQIAAQAQEAITALRLNTAPKIPLAKKEIFRCP